MKISHLSLLLLLSLGFVACEKVIEVDLDDTEIKLVIEAVVHPGIGNNEVTLTRSTNYFDASESPMVSGATIRITDNAGQDFQLIETSPGKYSADSLEGIVGRSYSLEVQSEGNTYRAMSTMPEIVQFDSLVVLEATILGDDDLDYVLRGFFQDPPNQRNYYRFSIFRNGNKLDGFFANSDELFAGEYVEYPFIQQGYALGDSARVIAYSIDEHVLKYFQGLDNSNDVGDGSAAPGNPETNISGDALGYFSAEGFQEFNLIIQ